VKIATADSQELRLTRFVVYPVLIALTVCALLDFVDMSITLL
jgi:hypothetical protein